MDQRYKIVRDYGVNEYWLGRFLGTIHGIFLYWMCADGVAWISAWF